MPHLRFLISSVALFLGIAILGISLSTVTVAQSAGGAFTASHRQLYLDREMLPDHLAYPLLMIADRAKLEAAVPLERIYLQVEYGNRRLDYATQLLDKDNEPLALTTATKGYKYLIQAAQDSLDQQAPDSVRQYVLKVLDYQISDTQLRARFTDANRAILDHLLEEMQPLVEQLRSSLTSS